MADRIEKRLYLPMGMGTQPENIDELENRKEEHRRRISGKPVKAFGDLLDEKMHGKKKRDDEDEEETPEKGAKDPLLGLSTSQSPELAKGGKGRRGGKVILKG